MLVPLMPIDPALLEQVQLATGRASRHFAGAGLSMKTITAYLESSLADAKGEVFQFERHGYFKRDKGTFIRTCSMRDSRVR
jgi:hypothetical protein